ncbi:hypothetical protein RFI_28577, partial [Reticulomyxa filosa]
TAFVRFNSLFATTVCISTPLRFGLSTLKVEKAEAAKNLRWDTLQYSRRDLWSRNVIIMVLFVMMLLFWSVPVTAIQVLANLNTFCDVTKWNCEKVFGQNLMSFVQAWFAVLILDVWLISLPGLCRTLSSWQYKTTLAKVEQHTLRKYFDCLLCMVLLVSVFAGIGSYNINRFVHDLAHSASSWLHILAEGLSRMSTYFILYVLLNALIWAPLEFYRPGYWGDLIFDPSDRHRFSFSTRYPKIMLILIICLAYGAMTPLIWIFGFIYFAFIMLINTYQQTFCFIPHFDTGAMVFPIIFDRIVIGMHLSVV